MNCYVEVKPHRDEIYNQINENRRYLDIWLIVLILDVCECWRL